MGAPDTDQRRARHYEKRINDSRFHKPTPQRLFFSGPRHSPTRVRGDLTTIGVSGLQPNPPFAVRVTPLWYAHCESPALVHPDQVVSADWAASSIQAISAGP